MTFGNPEKENWEVDLGLCFTLQPWCHLFLWLNALVAQSCLTLCNSMDSSPPGSSVHRDSPGKNTGEGCHSLLQGIFPTKGLNLGLLHCRQILYCLSHWGSPMYDKSSCIKILQCFLLPQSSGPWAVLPVQFPLEATLALSLKLYAPTTQAPLCSLFLLLF